MQPEDWHDFTAAAGGLNSDTLSPLRFIWPDKEEQYPNSLFKIMRLGKISYQM
jgi:hypothetical protein